MCPSIAQTGFKNVFMLERPPFTPRSNMFFYMPLSIALEYITKGDVFLLHPIQSRMANCLTACSTSFLEFLSFE